MYPCYKCLAPRSQLHYFETRYPLRHNALINYHVATMEEIANTQSKTAAEDYGMI